MKHIFSRSLFALPAFVALATGIALPGAPSMARAETANQIIMSEGRIDCPPCRWLKTYNQNGLSFSDVVAEVQDDGQVVITAEVLVAGTAGKPRMGSVVFSAFMNYSDDASFMDYTDDSCMQSLTSRQAGTQACDAVSRALRDSGPIIMPVTPAEGIIMRDGGVCDPIRHMGC